MKNTLLSQFLRRPLTTGAVCPSCEKLANTLITDIAIEHAKNVVELGPGTGAVTRSILHSIHSKAQFFAVELNPEVLMTFRERFPSVRVYNDSASNLKKLMEYEGVLHVDAIISGLPWAAFSDRLQEEILTVIFDSLTPGGYFTTFAYIHGVFLPTGQQFKKRLMRIFPHVEKSPVVWKNIPPAFVYKCRK
ncbi:MAG: 16S ribosomal RNA methyltransferase KsgA/Dim1 family protein [Lentisphaerae bacterium ADurb.Bin242]|nr:MAG: 16S ribosomal RNA methyltransferase KsgA/Dim1 family protein [Lentisphaerae bacterium ADurb.Bin242]